MVCKLIKLVKIRSKLIKVASLRLMSKEKKMVVQEAKEAKPELKGFSYYFNSHTNYGRANVSLEFNSWLASIR